MSDLFFKNKGQSNPNVAYFVSQDSFVIHPRNAGADYCEEYETIKKIQRNEDGFFNFSKSIIDIGAEDGNYAMLLDFQHSYCFEPNKRSLCLLYANMYLKDKVDNTEVYCTALGEAPGVVNFDGFNCENSKPLGGGEGNPYLASRPYQVPVATLDSFNIKDVGLIKIDVEGYEERVIRGGLLTIISNGYPPILFECWEVGYMDMTQERHDSLFGLLQTLGYQIFEYWGDKETHLAIHNYKQ